MIKFLIVDDAAAAAAGDGGWIEVCCKISPVAFIGPGFAMDTVFRVAQMPSDRLV